MRKILKFKQINDLSHFYLTFDIFFKNEGNIMVQTFNPFGFSFASYKGGKYRAASSQYPIQSGAAFTFGGNPTGLASGDLVGINSNGANPGYIGPANTNGTSTAATALVLGVFVNVQYTDPSGTFQELPIWARGQTTFGGFDGAVTVDDVPLSVYNVQANQPLMSTYIGRNYSFSMQSTGDNTNLQQSTMFLDVSSYEQNALASLKIVGLAPIPNNNWTDPYPIVQVIINNHMYKPGTSGF